MVEADGFREKTPLDKVTKEAEPMFVLIITASLSGSEYEGIV